ncbi:MAG: hypothetical protein NDJ92_05065 [Thermoanaerobaculia bacterium]|nr:hypothetical protein [Thermoanaerobaculia bacterium]
MRRARNSAGAVALAIAILGSAPAGAAEANKLPKSYSDKSTRTVEVRPGGILWIDNSIGSIIVTGGGDKVVVETTRVLRAADDATLEALKKGAVVNIGGSAENRIVKSTGLANAARAFARIDYVVTVPANTTLNLISGVAEKVRVSGMSAKLYVRNWRGSVEILDAKGLVQVDTVNANVLASFSQRPVSGSQFSSVNGNIEIRLPQASKFEWYAETMKGDIMAGFPVKGRAIDKSGQRTFQASVNGGGPASIRASTITGRIYLLPFENARSLAASVLPQAPQQQAPRGPAVAEKDDIRGVYQSVVQTLLIEPPSARSFVVRKSSVAGNYEYVAHLGENVFVGQIEGYARILAAGGEVVLGRVAGDCTVRSQGGPVNLGEISGTLEARTLAGGVSVRSAKKGGRVYTGGGSVNVRYSGGPLTIESAGGDVAVSDSSSRVAVSTRSGDIRVKLDPRGAGEASELRTARGNVLLEIGRTAKFNVDATIMMDADAANRVESDFPGLTIVRERVGDRMRVHATGKVNGGGPVMTIAADSGNIQLRRAPDSPVGPALR